MVDEIFDNKKANFDKLTKFAFKKQNDIYTYEQKLSNPNFLLKITIGKDDKVNAKIIDIAFNDEYNLHNVQNFYGPFKAQISNEYQKILTEISEKCFENIGDNKFNSIQAKEIIEYIKNKYHDELEFLWDKYPKSAIARCKETKKWYLLITKIKASSLKLNLDKEIVIINLHNNEDEILKLLNNKQYFLAYHMNKKHWYTIILDNGLESNAIFKQIDESYKLALSK